MSHPRKLVLFVGLSLADFGLTWFLVAGSGGPIVEGNPLARWWLTAAGWLGLFAFKASTVVAVCGIAWLVTRHHPRLAGQLLGFSCAALGTVVVYSSALAGLHAKSGADRSAEGDGMALFPPERSWMDYSRLQQRLCAGLAAGRGSLSAAVEALANTERGRDPKLYFHLRIVYRGLGDRECLAAVLLAATAAELDPKADESRRTVEQLLEEFERLFGHRPPWTDEQLWLFLANTRPTSPPSRPARSLPAA